jgi:hypothetical protein
MMLNTVGKFRDLFSMHTNLMVLNMASHSILWYHTCYLRHAVALVNRLFVGRRLLPLTRYLLWEHQHLGLEDTRHPSRPHVLVGPRGTTP